jgi:hypothetical protein
MGARKGAWDGHLLPVSCGGAGCEVDHAQHQNCLCGIRIGQLRLRLTALGLCGYGTASPGRVREPTYQLRAGYRVRQCFVGVRPWGKRGNSSSHAKTFRKFAPVENWRI